MIILTLTMQETTRKWGERWGLENDEGVREQNHFLVFNSKSLHLNVNDLIIIRNM